MFLVEPQTGQRCHYTSARALGGAIRRGELGPEARIFHQASSQWLPITVHPEYRRAESEWEEQSARQMRGRRWTFLSERPEAQPLESEMARPLDAAPVPMLVPGGSEASWLGSAFRSLIHLARPGA